MKNFQNYLSTDIKSFKDTKIKKIKDNNEVENKIKDNKKLIKKKLIIGIFLAIIGLITFIMLIFFFLIDNNNYRGRGIYSNKISLSYEEAKSLLNFEVIENNDFLLNNISDGVNNSILICQQYNINDIPSEIIYNSPYFLENPTKTSLKIVKSDLDIYKGKYEELSKEINILGNTSILFFNNFSYSIEKMKDEVNKIIYQFKYVIKNISIPLIYMEKILKNNRMLNEDVENINNKLSLFTKIEEYKNETEKLNILYNKMFKYIEESVQLINNEIIEFSNSFIELQNEIEEGMSNFEQIIDNFENPDDILFFHENLKAMKTNFVSIKNELIIKKEMSENRIKKIENSYINERNKIKIEKIKEESNEILANLKIKSKSIKNDIIGELKKNYLNSVEIPELSASNIIFDLIDKTLNYSGFSWNNNSLGLIITEEIEINNEFEQIQTKINVEEKTSLDLLYIMDITTSMKPYLVQVQQNLLNIINKIILECPGIDLNIGFIGFRDVTHTESYVNLEFTQNHEELKNSINNVYTSKGDDGNEEDIEEGIEMALKKDWKSNARFAILVTDFPCHGIKYSLNSHDIYPNGNPNRRNIEVLINELAEHQISLFCIKVTSYTDKMFEIFNTIYNSYEKCKFKVIPLKSETNFTQVVVESSTDIYMNQRNMN